MPKQVEASAQVRSKAIGATATAEDVREAEKGYGLLLEARANATAKKANAHRLRIAKYRQERVTSVPPNKSKKKTLPKKKTRSKKSNDRTPSNDGKKKTRSKKSNDRTPSNDGKKKTPSQKKSVEAVQELCCPTEVPEPEDFDRVWEQARAYAISKSCTPRWLHSPLQTGGIRCSNCFRSPICNDPSSSYYLKYCCYASHRIKKLRTPLKRVMSTNECNATTFILCEDCYRFLGVDETLSKEDAVKADRRRYSWENIWASVFCDMLFGKDMSSGKLFQEVYSLEELWRLVPVSLRPYWMPYLETYLPSKDKNIVGKISEESPPSFFADRTEDISNFDRNIMSYTYKGFLNALDPHRLPGVDENDCVTPSILPDVLCPWGCTEFAHRSSRMNIALVIQNYLRRVVLNIPQQFVKQMHTVETSWPGYFSDKWTDTVLLNDDWSVLPSVQLVRGSGLHVLCCREHSSACSRKRLYTHPPRKPHHNLSCCKAAQLSPCCLRPNTLVPQMAKKHCTQTTVRCTQSCFFGCDSANITLNHRFQCLSEMLHNDETLSYAGREDIRVLAQELFRQGKMSEELYSELVDESNRKYMNLVGEEFLASLRVGATFCPKKNAFILQQASSQNPKIEAVVLQRSKVGGELTPKTYMLARPWLPCIYNCQEEDIKAYGCRMKAILPYRWTQGVNKRSHTMMTYCLASLAAGSCDFYCALDQKHSAHRYDEISGHLLTHVCFEYFREFTLRHHPKSPFVGKLAAGRVRELIDDKAPRRMKTFRGSPSEDAELFYRFNVSYLRKLLNEEDYPSISVLDSVDSITSRPDVYASKKILIVIGSYRPKDRASIELSSTLSGPVLFEARVVMSFTSKNGDSNPSNYDCTRISRHGGGVDGYSNWWRQARNGSLMMTQDKDLREKDDVYPALPTGFQYVTLFVRVDRCMEDSYHMDFFKSIGAQCDVFCSCSELNPLLISGARPCMKRQCMTDGCEKKEKYCCGKSGCATRICSQCFSTYEKEGSPVFLRPEGSSNVDDENLSHADIMEESEDESYEEDVEDESCDDNDLSFDCSGEWYPDVEDQIDSNLDTDTEDDILESDEYYSSSDTNVGWNNDENVSKGNDVNFDEFDDPDYGEDGDSVSSAESYDSDDDDDDCSDLECVMDDSKPSPKRRKIRDGIVESASRIGVDVQSTPTSVDSLLTNFAVTSEYDAMNTSPSEFGGGIPRTNAADLNTTLVSPIRTTEDDGKPSSYAPMHILFNQFGRVCTRFNKSIRGTNFQRYFIQKLVSSVRGISWELMYLDSTLFPNIYWADSARDRHSILGCRPISCYRNTTNPDGFASTIQVARCLATHVCSPAATDHNYTAFLFDVEANKAACNIHSNLLNQHGFKVSNVAGSSPYSSASVGNIASEVGKTLSNVGYCNNSSKPGITVRGSNDANLSGTMDSSQAAMNLAAASQDEDVGFDKFLTFTVCQSTHPGIRHLFEYKESLEWTKHIPRWKYLSSNAKWEYRQAYEMAYMTVVNRAWAEVRSLLLDFIMKSTSTCLGRVIPVFFRDEYQEENGNLCHIHGLIGLYRNDLDNEQFKEFVCHLQRSAVCDLILPEEIPSLIEKGLLKDRNDYNVALDQAGDFLGHTCSDRCQICVGDKGDPSDYRCKKPHPVFDSIHPLTDDFIPLKINWSDPCLKILQECDLYEEPSSGFPNGRMKHQVLNPTRHMGRVTPSARDNMSPVIQEFFLLTRSMQNSQVLTNTNGVSRYVVKYIVKLDQGNRCVIWSDSHSGAVLKVEKQFLHNTKISRSFKNETSLFRKSRGRNHPTGRAIAFTEMQSLILGFYEVVTNIEFVQVPTKPFENRSTTSIKLCKQTGKVIQPTPDVTSSKGDMATLRKLKKAQVMTKYQELTMKGTVTKSATYDNVTLFSIRPVEMMELFAKLRDYYRWFRQDKTPMTAAEISEGLNSDVTKCMWIDGVGRRVRMRKKALNSVSRHLENIKRMDVGDLSWRLRNYLLRVINDKLDCPLFIDDVDASLPVPVFSNVSPANSSQFLLHMMLVLGNVQTELELKTKKSMKNCFAEIGLIPDSHLDSTEHLKRYTNTLLRKVIIEVFSVYPITMRKMQRYIITTK